MYYCIIVLLKQTSVGHSSEGSPDVVRPPPEEIVDRLVHRSDDQESKGCHRYVNIFVYVYINMCKERNKYR